MNLSEDADARRINALPWKPLPGMLKLRCSVCSYWFATPAADVAACPDCAIRKRIREERLLLNGGGTVATT